MAKKKQREITPDIAREWLIYEPDTGLLRWRKAFRSNMKVGDVVGAPHCQGYIQVGFRGRMHLAHRLIWFYVHGYWPTCEIDHVNGDKTDNRLCNLREATSLQNKANVSVRSTKTTTNLKGAFPRKNNRWAAYIKINGRQKFLGHHSTAEAAHQAYMRAARVQFGEFARG